MNSPVMNRFVLLTMNVLLIGARPVLAQEGPIGDLDDFVEKVRENFEVPGVAVAVVKDGKVVTAKGYGVRTLGKTERVDARTKFGIASNTKLFTATALGILVEENKLEWDAPVIRYLPWFQLGDPYVTRELTVRDLLVHRSGLGLGAGDLLWWPPSNYTRREIAYRLRYLPLASSFRSTYAYDNVLYTVAGELIESVSGMSWEDFVQTRILARVGMTESTVRHSSASGGADVATPHARIGGRVQPVDPFASDNTNPAGGINSCAEDMAKWLVTQLDSGRVADGSHLFSRETTRQLWALVTPLPIGSLPADMSALRPNFNGYGLGIGVRDYRGKKLLVHTGGLPGYVSKICMVPEAKLGIAVLTNQEAGGAFEAISYHILDAYLGAQPTDWIVKFHNLQVRHDSLMNSANLKVASKRDSLSHASLPLTAYAGTYADAWYGNVDIEYNAGALSIKFSHTPALEGELEHWQHDTFVARWRDRELRADAFVTFALNPDGTIDQVKVRAVSPATDFSFDFQDLLLKPLKEGSKTLH